MYIAISARRELFCARPLMPMEGYFRITENLREGTRRACPRNLIRSPKKSSKKLRRPAIYSWDQLQTKESGMNREFQQYRFARIEARNITRARLEAQFKNGIGGLEEIEKAIEQLIMTEPACTPWRTSEVERAASRDGTRMAALEF